VSKQNYRRNEETNGSASEYQLIERHLAACIRAEGGHFENLI